MPQEHREDGNGNGIFLRSLLAGAFAGTTVDISLYPIDTIKTRLQSSSGFVASGGFRGVYAGIGSAIVGSAPGAALFFVSYEALKEQLQQWRKERRVYGWEAVDHMLAASMGEVAACAVRVPTEVVKQRAQAKQLPSSWAVLADILGRRHTHGLRATWLELYRGWGVMVMREVPFTVIQFPLWEGLKQRWSQRTGNLTTGVESAVFGCVSGAVAAALTTPLDVLKTRMMLARTKQGLVPLTRRILQEEGSRAFVAGLGPRVAWISAGGAVFLGSYQWAANALRGVV